MLEGAKKAGSAKEPLIMTICGDAGSGKTSLAATLPDAFIIRTQGEAVPRDVPEEQMPLGFDPIGGRRIDVNGVKIWDENELWEQLTALLTEEHDRKSVIFDSATGLEALFVQNILDVQPPKQKTMNAAGNGYGSAWDLVVAKMSRVRKAAELLRTKRGMNVAFIAHVDVNRMDPPDGEPYTKYELQLHKKVAPILVNNVDLVGFMKQETIIMEGKGRTTGTRLLSVDMTPANVSKNRLGIVGDITVKHGENPFKDYM